MQQIPSYMFCIPTAPWRSIECRSGNDCNGCHDFKQVVDRVWDNMAYGIVSCD